MFLELEGVGPRIADVLIKGGMDTVEKIAHSKAEDLTVFAGIGEKLAEKMIESAKHVLANPPVIAAKSEGPAEEESDENSEEGDIVVEGSTNGHVEPTEGKE
jgi:Holliday junction resolvasome RuvABC DNA-binding subunit